MSADPDLLVILSTAPDRATAETLARGLVEQRLAACVNAIAGVRSVYRWKEDIEVADEIQLVIKTRRGRFEDVATWLRAHHPYDVPEIIALPAERVSEAYLEWAIEETS